MSIILLIIFLSSITTLIFSHPIILILTFTINACLLATAIFIHTFNFWFPIIIILTLVGGLIVLFAIAICSLNSYNVNPNFSWLIILIATIITISSSSENLNILPCQNNSIININSIYSISWGTLSVISIILLMAIKIILSLLVSPNNTINSTK